MYSCGVKTIRLALLHGGGDPSLLLSTGKTHLEYYVLCWASQYVHTGMSPTKGQEHDAGLGPSVIGREAERGETV